VVQLLLKFPVISTSYIRSVVTGELGKQPTAKRQEKKDYWLGRIFSVLVLQQSGRVRALFTDADGEPDTAAAANPPAATVTLLRELIGELRACAQFSVNIRDVAYAGIGRIVADVPVAVFSAHIWQELAPLFTDSISKWDIETISLALAIRKYLLVSRLHCHHPHCRPLFTIAASHTARHGISPHATPRHFTARRMRWILVDDDNCDSNGQT
jgi:hypothetical protein